VRKGALIAAGLLYLWFASVLHAREVKARKARRREAGRW
jgi:hypothetical protein